MKSLLSVLSAGALLLTGCSSTSPESTYGYDEVELMIYEKCIEEDLHKYDQIKPNFSLFSPDDLISAQENCLKLKPSVKLR